MALKFFCRKKRNEIPTPALYFKDEFSAFEYACRYMSRPLDLSSRSSNLIIGYVHGRVVPIDNDSIEGLLSQRGTYFDVSLATEGGPIRVQNCGTILEETARDMAEIARERRRVVVDFPVKVEPPRLGDLVAIEIANYNPQYPPGHFLNYFAIVYRLIPEIHPPEHMFRLELEALLSNPPPT
jgi:hypothetical protein